jgi:hypothetical protein
MLGLIERRVIQRISKQPGLAQNNGQIPIDCLLAHFGCKYFSAEKRASQKAVNSRVHRLLFLDMMTTLH